MRIYIVHAHAGRLEEARAMLTEAVRTRREVLGERASGTLTAINSLGTLLSEMGEQAQGCRHRGVGTEV